MSRLRRNKTEFENVAASIAARFRRMKVRGPVTAEELHRAETTILDRERRREELSDFKPEELLRYTNRVAELMTLSLSVSQEEKRNATTVAVAEKVTREVMERQRHRPETLDLQIRYLVSSELKEHEQRVIHTVQRMLNATLSQMADLLREQEERLMSFWQGSPDSKEQGEPKSNETLAQKKPRKWKIVVYGEEVNKIRFYREVFDKVETELPVRVTHYTNDEDVSCIKEHAHAVIVMTKFIGHAAEAALKSAYRGKVYKIDGNATKVVNRIRQLWESRGKQELAEEATKEKP